VLMMCMEVLLIILIYNIYILWINYVLCNLEGIEATACAFV